MEKLNAYGDPYAIKWERWIDPLKTGNPGEVDEFVDEEELKEWEDKNPEETIFDFNRPNTVKNTMVIPYGIIPLDTANNPAKFFDWTIGHTNFPLELDDIAGLDNILGVETIDFFSAYRFRIGIGKMFVDRREKIKKSIFEFLVGRRDGV